MKIKILAADQAELEYIDLAKLTPCEASTAETGIGFASAAIGAYKALSQDDIDLAVFVGSCGAARPDVSLLSIVNASFVSLGDLSLAKGESYLPEQVNQLYHSDDKQSGLIQKNIEGEVHNAGIYCPLSISKSSEIAESIVHSTEAYFENLELFSVAEAAVELGVPWVCISCVTNYVGANAHEEWKENREAAARRTAEVIEEIFSPGRLPLPD
ncbi:hypothetical protein BVY02_01175 [bacterium J17]|nr:hypothetical protein BVY02_01175 [bacterium J17]